MLFFYLTRHHPHRHFRCLSTFSNPPHRLSRETDDAGDVARWNIAIADHMRRGLCAAARDLFDRMPRRTTSSYNALLHGYLLNRDLHSALQIFHQMPDRDLVSYNTLLHALDLSSARKLFDEMPERDAVSWNTLIVGYLHNHQLDEARRLFDAAPRRDVFTWTTMVSGYAQHGMLDDARALFDSMRGRNAVSWNAMIAGYARHGKMEEAEELFDRMPCRNTSSWNTMLTGYARNGDIGSARKMFDSMQVRDSISWAAMVAAYAQCGFSEEALKLLVEMERCGESLNKSSFTSALSICADTALLGCGRQLHGKLIKGGYQAGCFVGNAVLGMYCKCGSIDEALDAFHDVFDKDVVTWNTMITGYASHGFGYKALEVFGMMIRNEIKPDDITLVAVLSACRHAGLIERGKKYFDKMRKHYGITAKAEHYACMIDILGRAGHLEEAYELLKDVPFKPDVTMWGALLGASRKYGNTELGEIAAEHIFEMDPDNAGMYVLLSNLYAASGKWKNVGRLRVMMRDRGVKKVPGYSWIEVMNKVHYFSVGDSLHPERELIYSFIEELDIRLKKAGHKSSTKMILHDVEEEEKEHMLKYHSERLAIAYGILKIQPGQPIRVIKNLRVCEDCHSVIKQISAMEGRLIILRDSIRFHHFKGGLCSCGDYW